MTRIPGDTTFSTIATVNATETDVWYYIWWMDLIRVIISVVVPFFGLVGNLLVILTVYNGYIKHSTANLLIANLAVSDSLFSLQNVVFLPASIALERSVFADNL